MQTNQFTDLILLIGTNPLPNFVVADYFLQKNQEHLQKIWLIHSQENELQAGTNEYASNLEKLLRKRWEKQHAALQFPLEKISLSDVSNAKQIHYDLQNMLKTLSNAEDAHLNYTGGTSPMGTQTYLALKEQASLGKKRSFSYLDARKFRLIDDELGVIEHDLRTRVQLTFDELIALHGFQRCNKGRTTNFVQALAEIEERVKSGRGVKNIDGLLFEDYIVGKIEQTLKNKFNNSQPILQDWEIQKPDWGTKFQMDAMLLHGYQLTGVSCTAKDGRAECKNKGFEVILRTRQIGGDEAKAILVTGMKSNDTQLVQKELMYETGGNKKNILVLGVDDLKNDLFIRKIDQFIFG